MTRCLVVSRQSRRDSSRSTVAFCRSYDDEYGDGGGENGAAPCSPSVGTCCLLERLSTKPVCIRRAEDAGDNHFSFQVLVSGLVGMRALLLVRMNAKFSNRISAERPGVSCANWAASRILASKDKLRTSVRTSVSASFLLPFTPKRVRKQGDHYRCQSIEDAVNARSKIRVENGLRLLLDASGLPASKQEALRGFLADRRVTVVCGSSD